MSAAKTRLYYLDNLKIFLTILVVLHHLAITYGAPGDWYYQEIQENNLFIQVLFTLFVAGNQVELLYLPRHKEKLVMLNFVCYEQIR